MINENENLINEEEKLSNQQSLEIIHKMISQARNQVTNDGNEWIIWGTLIFLASVTTYILIEIQYSVTFLGWNIFGLIAILMLSYRLIKRKPSQVRTYLGDLLKLFDVGFIICMLIIIFSINVAVSPNAGFGYLLMIYAFLMLIQGGAMKFKPLIIGAVINWIGALAIFYNKEFKYDMLITAGAVLFGYIIPGLILRSQSRKSKKITTGDNNGV
ncbi:MAG: hypothetical protein ABIW38_00540 [Ferruginibacter sp.]